MNKNIKISIIVPVYNGEKYIEKTLNKLLKIKTNKEIIVINDCSTDNSRELLKKYEDSIKLIDLKENHGVSYARNMGIEKSSGNYIGFVDIDDSIEISMFDKMIEQIEDSDICVCNYDEFFENTDKIVNSKYNLNYDKLNHDEALKEFLTDNISPAIWDKIYKKELLENIRFDSSLKIGEDILFCLNVFLKAEKITFINERLYHYLQQENSAMHKVSDKLLQFNNVVEKINIDDYKYLEKKFSEQFDYFKLEMVTRGIHSLSSISNKNNKKIVYEYLKKYTKKEDLNEILKCKYYSKSIKLEIFILKVFGIKFHLFMTPFYKKIRSVIR